MRENKFKKATSQQTTNYNLLFIFKMAKIKLVSWDVYGTIISTGGDETSDVEELEKLRLREGALEALIYVRSKGITQITSSDGDLENLKNNLKEAGIIWTDFFDSLYKMTPLEPKDFSNIFKIYKIKPNNLLVIGDSYDIDIDYAKRQGCYTLYVPGPMGKTSFEEIKRFIC